MRRWPHVFGLSVIGIGLVLVVVLAAGEYARRRPPRFEWAGNEVRVFGGAALARNAALRLPCCDAYLNGRGPYRVLLDSGAGAMLLIRDDVAHEVELPATQGAGEVFGLGGSATLTFGTLDKLQIGEIECRRVLTGVATVESAPPLRLLDGVLGLGAFAQGRVTLDLARERIIVERSSASAGRGTPFDIRVTESKHVAVTISPADRRATAILDTGSQCGIVSEGWMRAHFPERKIVSTPLPMFGFGDSLRTMNVIGIGELEFAGRKGSFAAVVSPDLGAGMTAALDGPLDAILGMDWLGRARTITIDYPTQRAWIEWIEP